MAESKRAKFAEFHRGSSFLAKAIWRSRCMSFLFRSVLERPSLAKAQAHENHHRHHEGDKSGIGCTMTTLFTMPPGRMDGSSKVLKHLSSIVSSAWCVSLHRGHGLHAWQTEVRHEFLGSTGSVACRE